MGHMSDHSQIQPADPIARRKAIVWSCVAGGLLALFALFLSPGEARLQAWIVDHSDLLVESPLTAAGLMFVFLSPIVIGAFFAIGYSERVRRDQRFPPAGAKVIRDTPILQGAQALARATKLKVLGYLLFAIVCATVFLTWRIFHSFGTG